MSNHSNIRKIDLSGTFACIGALILWTLGPIFIKYFTGYVDSWTQNLLRYSVASVFWLPMLFIAAGRKQLDKKVWLRAIVPALANITMQSLYACAFYYIEPGFMTLLTKTSIIWTASFSLVFFAEEKTLVKSKRFWSGLLLLIIGVFGVVYFKKDFTATKTLTGIIIALVMAFMWAVYTISAKIAFKDIDSRHGFSVLSIYTVGGLLVLGLLFGNVGECVKMGAWQWACIVISGVTSIALAHTLYYASMKRIGATIPALVLLAQPFMVLGISYVVFRETLSSIQLLFGVVLLAGAGLAIWAQQHLKRIVAE